MSKRVEVRVGDKFSMWSGALYRKSASGVVRRVWADGVFELYSPITQESHPAFTSDQASELSPKMARAIIESLGGEWAEVAAEKPATTTTLTMHVSEYRCDGLIVLYKSKRDFGNADYLGTTTITIAGVTT
jgi:hypothetical protein